MLTLPKDTPRLKWTAHIKNKMIFYNLSGQQVLTIFRRPERVEEGVAPQTVAAMRTKKALGSKEKKSSEVWIMYRVSKRSVQQASGLAIPVTTLISAWRYPGVTKPGSPVPIPAEIREELENIGEI